MRCAAFALGHAVHTVPEGLRPKVTGMWTAGRWRGGEGMYQEGGMGGSEGGVGPQLVRCGPATVAPATPAPRPSLLSQFITCSSGQWPCLCSKQFHVPASLAGVRAVGLRFWALLPGDTAHMILSPGRGVGGGGLAGTPLLLGSPYGPRRRRAQNF